MQMEAWCPTGHALRCRGSGESTSTPLVLRAAENLARWLVQDHVHCQIGTDTALSAPFRAPPPSFAAAADRAEHTVQCSDGAILYAAQILKSDQEIKPVLSQRHTHLVPRTLCSKHSPLEYPACCASLEGQGYPRASLGTSEHVEPKPSTAA